MTEKEAEAIKNSLKTLAKHNKVSSCEPCATVAENALKLIEEHERIIREYQKLDGFLEVYGWKWKDGEQE